MTYSRLTYRFADFAPPRQPAPQGRTEREKTPSKRSLAKKAWWAEKRRKEREEAK